MEAAEGCTQPDCHLLSPDNKGLSDLFIDSLLISSNKHLLLPYYKKSGDAGLFGLCMLLQILLFGRHAAPYVTLRLINIKYLSRLMR